MGAAHTFFGVIVLFCRSFFLFLHIQNIFIFQSVVAVNVKLSACIRVVTCPRSLKISAMRFTNTMDAVDVTRQNKTDHVNGAWRESRGVEFRSAP
jgi:hypothetical protein